VVGGGGRGAALLAVPGVVAAAVPGNPVTSEAVEEGAGGEPVALLSAVESAGEEEGGVSRPEVEEVFASELVVGEGNEPSMLVSGMLPVLRRGAGEAASAEKGLFPSGSAGGVQTLETAWKLALKLGSKGSSAEVLSPIKRCGGGTRGRTEIGK
ncbi:hypothetical protein MTO96_046970, partial [Rhipicephalus appendiculatus]